VLYASCASRKARIQQTLDVRENKYAKGEELTKGAYTARAADIRERPACITTPRCALSLILIIRSSRDSSKKPFIAFFYPSQNFQNIKNVLIGQDHIVFPYEIPYKILKSKNF
jgi:hypothetical protein